MANVKRFSDQSFSMSQTKHHIVQLDSWVHLPPLDFEHEIIKYPSSRPEDLPERVKDATIISVSGTRIPRSAIESAPHLQLVSCNSTGTDHVDKDALRERGIALCHVPAQNTDSVTEHAFALYFSLRRQIIPMHDITISGDIWQRENLVHLRFKTPPRTNSEETLVIVGYGALGKRVEKMGQALGMRVLIAERKGSDIIREGRIPFEDALIKGTIFIVVAPLDAGTRNTFAASEFEKMDPTSIIINVGRGSVVNEADLATALRAGKIGGAAVDVFDHEPATKETSPLIDPSIPNLVLSPHIAWFSSKTIKGTLATVKANIEGFVNGNPQNIVIPGITQPSR